MTFEAFSKLNIDAKLNVIYTELLIMKERDSILDDRPLEQQKEFPLRGFSLGVCICGHGDQDHATDLTHLGIKDGICQVCVCKEFTPQTRRGEKPTSC